MAAILAMSATGGVSSCSNCAEGCVNTLTFALATPLKGSQFVVRIEEGTPYVVATAQCQLGDASLSCTPAGSGLLVTDDGTALKTIQVTAPGAGTWRIEISVDGVMSVDQSFDYLPASAGSVCGAPCYKSVTLTVAD
jgi:hypothetical protein